MLQPILIVTLITLRVVCPKIKRFKKYFDDYFWNGFISALNGNTQISLICALITVVYYSKNYGDS
jgi:hypothetical protein